MALTVGEIMNRELLTVRAGDPVDSALAAILGAGVTAAPVVDPAHHVVGIVSLRDLLKPSVAGTVGGCMTRAVETLHPQMRIEHAAMTLAAGGFHHAPVVGEDGKPVGFVSALDLLRAFVGQPASHPDTFPHWDDATGAAWTDELSLSDARIDAAPRGPGVIVYIEGGRDRAETVIAVDKTHDVRGRLLDVLTEPSQRPELETALAAGRLRYRAASIADAQRRIEVATAVQEDMEDGWFERLLRR